MAHAVAPEGRASRRPSWWVLLGVPVAAVAVAAIVLAARDDDSGAANPRDSASPTAGTSQAPVRAVASFSGSGDKTTTTFVASLNWELRWTAPAGSAFAVELLNAKGASLGKVVTAGRKTSGATFVSQAGTFKLKVTSKEPWTIRVLSRPVPKRS